MSVDPLENLLAEGRGARRRQLWGRPFNENPAPRALRPPRPEEPSEWVSTAALDRLRARVAKLTAENARLLDRAAAADAALGVAEAEVRRLTVAYSRAKRRLDSIVNFRENR